MATFPHCGQARNRGALAQGRIPFVLEADLQSQEAHRETTDIEGSSGIDFPDGCWEPNVGSATHPASLWIVQQLREAFPFGSAPRFVIFDRDAKYGLEVPAAVRSLRANPVRTSFESPWQNGVSERWVGSCQRDLLDHIIAIDERHGHR